MRRRGVENLQTFFFISLTGCSASVAKIHSRFQQIYKLSDGLNVPLAKDYSNCFAIFFNIRLLHPKKSNNVHFCQNEDSSILRAALLKPKLN